MPPPPAGAAGPRRLRWAAAVLVALLVIAVAAVAAGSLARGAAQSWASRAAGAPVRVDTARVSLPGPRLVLLGLVVENPPGFEAEPALTVQRLSIDLRLSTLTSDVVRFSEIAAEGLELRYSRSADRSNLDEIERNLAAELERRGLSSAPRVVVERLRVRDGRAAAPAAGLRMTVPLEDLDYSDIGGDEGGLAPPELVAALFDLMEPSLGKALAHTDYGALLAGGVRGVKRGGKKALDKLKGLFK